MREHGASHRIIATTILIGFATSFGSAQPATTQGTRIVGKVTRVEGRTVYIEIDSEPWPREGDPVRLGQTLPGFDNVVYMRGSWRVSAVTPDHVVAEPNPDAVGEPGVDFSAEIDSADPQSRPAAAYRDVGSDPRDPATGEIPEWRQRQMASAAYELGLKHDEGDPRDPAAAAIYYRGAAEAGHELAAHRLAKLYAEGDGVPLDSAEAIRWYRYAADQGLPHAQRELGRRYKQGDGVAQDFAEAMRYYHLAAAQSELLPKQAATNDIGVMYAEGKGVSRDYAEAIRWFKRAIEVGSPWGYFNIAALYERGWGMPANRELAIRNYQEAARLGNERAQKWLRDNGTSW